ncbi:hypothetical protein V2G26_017531 [Clonostachys chloroleuca]|uniref:Uncharacterized protein n=1 Tax=Clonostachys chloroleuca TaxID=1926264 RepID=A0AA35Q6H5_9HYPO|nr:unnamed protein product [Clonostachys chloroleuca]
MRARLLLVPLFSVLVGTAAGAGLERRADESSSSESPKTSATNDSKTTSASASRSSSTDDNKTTSSSKTSDADVVVTSTKTVTGDVETVTSKTTVGSTKTVTVTSTKTKLETDTTTASGDVETSIVVVTTTVAGNAKRAVPEIPAATTAPAVLDGAFDLVRLAKRATSTEVVETTVAGKTTTVWETQSDEATTTKVVETEITSKVTITKNPDAASTTTITSTQTETSLNISTDVVTRTTTASSGASSTSSAGSGNSDGGNSGSNSGSDSGLSTGAKAGIGAGVGVAGLVLIIGLAWFCIRKRRDGADHDHDDLFPASEVPVGAGGARASTHTATMSHASISHQPSMSQSTAGGVYPTPARSPTFPNVAAEGYRGTAMGDGRSGYAKPEPYGAGYAKPEPYGSAYTRTSTGPSSMGSVQDAYAPPNRTSTYDSARGHEVDPANIGVASTSPIPHQYGTSGSRFSEMETNEQPYRPPYMDNVR